MRLRTSRPPLICESVLASLIQHIRCGSGAMLRRQHGGVHFVDISAVCSAWRTINRQVARDWLQSLAGSTRLVWSIPNFSRHLKKNTVQTRFVQSPHILRGAQNFSVGLSTTDTREYDANRQLLPLSDAPAVKVADALGIDFAVADADVYCGSSYKCSFDIHVHNLNPSKNLTWRVRDYTLAWNTHEGVLCPRTGRMIVYWAVGNPRLVMLEELKNSGFLDGDSLKVSVELWGA